MKRIRLLRALAYSAAATAAATALLFAYLSLSSRGRGIPCPLLLLTGWQCPACGMTRAALALLEWDISAAFSFNALWPLYAAYLSWIALSVAVPYVRRGELCLPTKPLWIHGAMLAVTVGYGILRNLP